MTIWRSTRRIRIRLVGLTLIEMIVALVLSSILMTALLGVTRRMMAVRVTSATLSQRMPDTTRLMSQLESDLLQSQSIRRIPSGFVLFGPIHRDAITLQRTHRTAHVIYRVTNRAEWTDNNQSPASWLVRESVVTDPMTGAAIRSDLEPVWRGVAGLQVTSDFMDALGPTTSTDELLFVGEEAALDAMPPTIRVTLVGPDATVLADRTFFHHREE